MNGTKIEVLIEDTRIKEYMCRWSPLTQTTHIIGLYRTVLVTLLADALYIELFRASYPQTKQHGDEHYDFVEQLTAYLTFRLLKLYGQCPVCAHREFDLLPHPEAQDIQLVLCQCCGAWAPNDGYYEWQRIGSGAGG